MHHLQDRDQRRPVQDRVHGPDHNVNNPVDRPLL